MLNVYSSLAISPLSSPDHAQALVIRLIQNENTIRKAPHVKATSVGSRYIIDHITYVKIIERVEDTPIIIEA